MLSKRLVSILSIGTAVAIVACAKELSAPHTTGTGAIRPDAPALLDENSYSCNSVALRAAGDWKSERLNMIGAPGLGEAPVDAKALMKIGYVRYDKATRHMVADAECILPKSRAAALYAAKFIASYFAASTPAAKRSALKDWASGNVDCVDYDNDQYSVCDGTYCYPTFAERRSTSGGALLSPASVGYWSCDNGCEIDYPTFDCGGGGGGTGGTDFGGGGGDTGVGSSDPPIFLACDDGADDPNAAWDPPADNPSDPPPTICQGADAASCMSNNPGVYVGAWPIPATGGLASHTAIATVPPPNVTELVGWVESATNQISLQKPTPHYGDFPAYKWVKVDDFSQVSTVNAGITKAANEYSGLPYTLGSNRFVASVLKYSNVTLTAAQQKAIGNAPGICHCGNCA